MAGVGEKINSLMSPSASAARSAGSGVGAGVEVGAGVGTVVGVRVGVSGVGAAQPTITMAMTTTSLVLILLALAALKESDVDQEMLQPLLPLLLLLPERSAATYVGSFLLVAAVENVVIVFCQRSVCQSPTVPE